MTAFGDYEPEDAWHPLDEISEQIENLRNRVRLLFAGRTVPVLETIDDVFEAVIAARRSRILNPRDELRANDLDEDINYLRGRL